MLLMLGATLKPFFFMKGAKWKATVQEILMNWWQLEIHRTEFQFYGINFGYCVIRTLVRSGWYE